MCSAISFHSSLGKCSGIGDLSEVIAIAPLSQKHPFFLDRMRLLNNSTLELLWTMDDSTGGNVLATSPWLKTCLFYFAIKNLGEIHRPSAWLPLAAVPVRDVTDAQGGASAITAAILQHFNNQKVHDWIWIRDVRVKVRILAYCGDNKR